MHMLVGIRGFFIDLLANLLANLLSPNTMMGIAVVAVWAAISAILWHRRQRAEGKPGMASTWFVILCFGIALLAVGGGVYGLALRSINVGPKVAETGPEETEIDLYTGK